MSSPGPPPLLQRTREDFTEIIVLTPVGRATVAALHLNRSGLVNMRRILYAAGEHPPIEMFPIAFGVIDALMVLFGKHADRTTTMLLQAFFSRFAIGFLGANVSLRMHPALADALVGLL